MDQQTIIGILVTVCIAMLGYLIKIVTGVQHSVDKMWARVNYLDKSLALVRQKLNLTLGDPDVEKDNGLGRNGT